MDAAFVPSEITIRHIVSHKLTLELGPSITQLGKPIRNVLFAVAAVWVVMKVVLKTGRGNTKN
jgi:hypothetical protein